MFGQKKLLEERIRVLEERSKYLEEKTKHANEIIENMAFEFDNLQNMIILGRPNIAQPQQNVAHLPQVSDMNQARTQCEQTAYLKPGRIDMKGTAEEDMALREGWWPSEPGGFRWAGRNGMYPVLHFNVAPARDYELKAKIFVPQAIANKPVKIFANDALVDEFVLNKEMQTERKIAIIAHIVASDKLKIMFKADFWKPKDVDPKINDERILSMAFEYIELA